MPSARPPVRPPARQQSKLHSANQICTQTEIGATKLTNVIVSQLSQKGAHSKPGEFQEAAGRGASATSRLAATTPRPRHERQRAGRPERPEAAGERKTNGLERSAAIDSLTGFLLERPRADATAGATYRQHYALGQRRPSQVPDQMAPDAQELAHMSQAPSGASGGQLDQLARLYLDSSTPLEVRVHLGETAHLHCKLRPNLDHSDQLLVSWFRNVSILTSGEFRYTSDERFKASHKRGTNDWLLEVHNVRTSDEGDFECQVNSVPRAASLRVRLVVIVAQLEIVEGAEVQVAEGEPVELTCRVRFSSPSETARLAAAVEDEQANETRQVQQQQQRRRRRRQTSTAIGATAYIYWYKEHVYLQDQRIQEQSQTSNGLEKVLRIGRARASDGGSYTCKLVPELTQVQPASARILVVSGGASGLARPSGAMLVVVLILASIARSIGPQTIPICDILTQS